jgi:ribosomal protein L7Ae-like RNA K-turn-binding protein
LIEKYESLLGFAIKAGKIVFGVDNIIKAKKACLIIVCSSLKENSVSKILNSSSPNRTIYRYNLVLEQLLHKEGIKAVAITDKQMATAIEKYFDTNFEKINKI